MKLALLGYDVEGRASYDYFKSLGHEVVIHDQNEALSIPEGTEAVLGENYLDNLDRYDLLIRTPGLKPSKILELNPNVLDKITTHTNEFFKVSPTKHIIGVTGTKGKGTTSTLIRNMLSAMGLDVHLGGNIGMPPLTFLDKLTPDSWVVLELSNFQLIDLKYSPFLAVCLLIVPEHLNWHDTLDEYIEAKSQLFKHQTKSDIAIYFEQNETSKSIASSGEAKLIPYYNEPGALIKDGQVRIDSQDICAVNQLKLIGEHNWQNVCAAVTAVWFSSENNRVLDSIRSVLTSFSGLEHRLEKVRELNQVTYYNDSFGTTPETSIAAIKSFTAPLLVILGGRAKGIGFSELAKEISLRSNVNCLLIGETKEEIASDLDKVGFSNYTLSDSKDIKEVVAQAQSLSQPGGVILLSPACTSFDMFKDYKDRGEQFKQAVQELV